MCKMHSIFAQFKNTSTVFLIFNYCFIKQCRIYYTITTAKLIHSNVVLFVINFSVCNNVLVGLYAFIAIDLTINQLLDLRASKRRAGAMRWWKTQQFVQSVFFFMHTAKNQLPISASDNIYSLFRCCFVNFLLIRLLATRKTLLN